jgi:N-acetylated-alpha-linked acidic dipeptidase
VHEVSLIEDMLPEDPTTSYPNRIPAYHAMSASGNVSAEYVYVGYAPHNAMLEYNSH